jgi:hypothetical protein
MALKMLSGHKDMRVEEWQEMVLGIDGKNKREPLTENARERFIHDIEWEPKKSTPRTFTAYMLCTMTIFGSRYTR